MIGLMNYNMSRKEIVQSQLASIELAYLKSLNGKELTLEQLIQIENLLVTNPRMMDHPEMYSGLEKVGEEFGLLKESTLSNQRENYTL